MEIQLSSKIQEIIERTKKEGDRVTNPWIENILKEKIAGFEALKIAIENIGGQCGCVCDECPDPDEVRKRNLKNIGVKMKPKIDMSFMKQVWQSYWEWTDNKAGDGRGFYVNPEGRRKLTELVEQELAKSDKRGGR